MASNALSPLKARPLRNPGQSLDEEIQKIFDDKVLAYFWYAGALAILTITEWVGVVMNAPRYPWIYTGLTVGAIAYGAWRIIPLRRRVRALRQGRDGERAVGQLLDGLREDGARIFHDVPGENFNLDHVVISERGIFVVETKTLSKPQSQARIALDGERLLVAGHTPDRDFIQQVRAQATWLTRLLEESTGKRFHVRAVLAFPGWYVDRSSQTQRDVWVLEPKELEGFIEHESTKLASSDVSLASFHLSRYIRANNKDL